MLMYLITVVYVCGMMVTGTLQSPEVCRLVVKYEKNEVLNGRQVVQTPNTTVAVQSAMECSHVCERNSDCVYFRHAEHQCSTFTSVVTASTSSLPGAVYYVEAGSNACGRVPGYLYLPTPRLCIKLSNKTDMRNHSESETSCSADGGRLLVLDNDGKYNHVITYLNSVDEEVYPEGWSSYIFWLGITKSTDGVFTWSTGSTFVPRWFTSLPSSDRGDDCCGLLNMGLIGYSCVYNYRYLCEISIDP